MVSAKKTLAQPAVRGDYWSCEAPIPVGNVRVPCNNANPNTAVLCTECGAPRDFNLKAKNMNPSNKNHTAHSTTATTDKPKTDKPSAKPAATATVAVAPAATPATAVGTSAAGNPVAATPPVKADKRQRFYSVKEGCTDYCARVLPIFVEKYGAPKDPWGVTMKERDGNSGPALKKVLKADAKEAEQKLLAAMSAEEKVAYAKAKRTAAAATKEAKKVAQKAALMAELKAELEAEGKLVKA